MKSADFVFGRHPEFGIVARNTCNLPAGQWMLDRLDFRSVPGHPHLYALADQDGNGQARTAAAVAALRRANFTVDADMEFEPLGPSTPTPRVGHLQDRSPEVAFAEHSQLGIVAAIDDHARLGGELLELHGWRHNLSLDIYTLPPETSHSDALNRLAAATVAMRRAALQVAVEPQLAQAVHHRRATQAPSGPSNSHDLTAQRISAAALARSPAASALPGKPPAPAPAAEAATPRTDPRISLFRTR